MSATTSPRPTVRAPARPAVPDATPAARRSAPPRRSPRPAPRGRGVAPRGRRSAPPPPVDDTTDEPAGPWWSVRVVGVMAFVLVFGSLLGLAVFHSILVQNQLTIDQLNKKVAAEEDRSRELRLRYADSGADARIIANARAFDMVLPRLRLPLAAVIPESGQTSTPSNHPFGIPPVTTLAPATTAPSATTVPATTVPATTAKAPATTAKTPATTAAPTTTRAVATTAVSTTTRATTR